MNESMIVWEFSDLKKRAEAVGITLLASKKQFEILDAPKSHGKLTFSTVQEAEYFIRGYELGYASDL